jgi:hypothetical protein
LHQFRDRCEKARTRHFVGVDSEDPITGAMRVQPAEVTLQIGDVDAEDSVGNARVFGKRGRVEASIGADDDFVCERPERFEQCPHSRTRGAGEAAHAQRHPRDFIAVSG